MIDSSSLALPSLADPPDAAGVARAVREHLAVVRDRLAALHHATRSGRRVNEAHSDAMDGLVSELTRRSVARGGEAAETSWAVMAVGGYGRRELSVYSDVDILILHDGRATAWVGGVVERLQRWLWDAGLTLGSATRTPEETLSMAAEDETVCTAVLDARRIDGDERIAGELHDGLLGQVRRDPEGFVALCQRLLEQRHAAYGESLYLLQPNLKEGAGGLRDFHAAWWAARVANPEVRCFADLEGAHRLTGTEAKALSRGLDFLWRLRNDLHLRTGRATDQMGFDHQESLADELGYRDVDGRELPVERFMRDYYRHARIVQNLSTLLLDLAARRARPGPTPRQVRNVEDGFRLAEGQLEIPDAEHLREDPLRLFEAFAVAQRHDVPLSRMARRLVRENLDLVDDALRSDPRVLRIIDRILSAEHRVMRSLMAMNDVGLFGAWSPEWAHIVCRWQQVTYHTYTVDVHSIFLVEELRRLWRGKYAQALPELTDLMGSVGDRAVLFLGCLLHDIGKGLGGGHSARGASLARSFLERIGLDEARRERVVFLVEYHLLMSHLAQRRDLSDPKLIVDFARVVRDRTNLRNLYLITFADIRASSRHAWSDWKGQLLRELFERTSEFLESGGDDPQVAFEQIEKRVEARQEAARRELRDLGVAESRIDAFFEEMPRRYFTAHSGPQIARHAMAMLSFSAEKVVATQVRTMRGDFSEFIVVTRDVHGVYARVAGVLTAKWINILGCHVYTTRSGLALEVYRLATPAGGPQELREVWRGLQTSLHAVLSHTIEVSELLRRRGRPVGVKAAPNPGPVQVEIGNEESDFYTIVDVTANDRLGLLYDLTRVIADHDLEVYVSKAATILDQVTDTFYLKDREGRKIHDPELLDRLREALFEAAQSGGSALDG